MILQSCDFYFHVFPESGYFFLMATRISCRNTVVPNANMARTDGACTHYTWLGRFGLTDPKRTSTHQCIVTPHAPIEQDQSPSSLPANADSLPNSDSRQFPPFRTSDAASIRSSEVQQCPCGGGLGTGGSTPRSTISSRWASRRSMSGTSSTASSRFASSLPPPIYFRFFAGQER